MDIRRLLLQRLAVSGLSLLTLAGLTCWSAARTAAQTPPPAPPNANGPTTPPANDAGDKNKPDKTGPDQTGAGKSDVKTDPQTPRPTTRNPLILTNPADSDPLKPDQETTSKDPKDYTHSIHPPVASPKQLPLFGYDIFKPARDRIVTKRAYERRRMERDLYGTSRTQQNANNRQSGTGANGTNSGQSGSGTDANGTNNGGPQNGPQNTPAANADGGQGANNNGSNGNNAGDSANNNGNNNNNGANTNNGNNTNNGASRQNTSNSGNSNNADNEAQTPIDSRYLVADPSDQMGHPVTANPPANYQLGAGDAVVIQYSSPTQDTQTLRRTIDANGRVLLPAIGPVSILGKTIDGAEKVLQSLYSKFFNNVQVSVTLGQLRTISVSVIGPAFQPGSYAVPSVSTAENLLFWAGGPTDEGSLRDIEVRRNGKIIGVLDYYKYQLGIGDGKDVKDIPLQDGDILQIQPRETRIAVSGEVRTQAIFELKEGETLRDALAFAGGVKASAVAQRVQIDTFDPGAARVLRDVDLNSPAGLKTPLYDGDVVAVFSVRDRLSNTVAIEGAIDQPSEYALTPNMRVSDLVNRARGPLNEYYPQAELHRWNPDNTDTLIKIDLDKALAHDPANDIMLTKWDRIKVYTREEVAWIGHHIVTIDGAVQKHGVYTASKNMHVSDLLRMAGGPLPNAYLDRAILLHQHDDGPPTMEYVSLGAVLQGDSGKDVPILDNDHLAIYSVGQAQFTPNHIVTIDGEVVAPGPYPRADKMKVSDLLIVSGGFRPNAGSKVVITHARRVVDTPNASLIKVAVNFDSHGRCAPQDDLPLEDGDVVTIQGTGGFIDDVQIIHVTGAVNNPGPITLTTKKLRLSDAIHEAGGLRPEAYPAGAEFTRDPKDLESDSQKALAAKLGTLNDLLNSNDYQRELAKAKIDAFTATGQAAADTGASTVGLLGGLSGGAAAASVPAEAAGALSNQLTTNGLPVSPARHLDSQPAGNIAINLPVALARPGGADDILLLDGDTIKVPETPTTVQLIGAVNNEVAVLYKPGLTLQQYIDQAGGFTVDAAKDRIEVARLGGGLIPAKKVGTIKPGDNIIVPTKVLAAKLTRNQNGISAFFQGLTSSVLVYKLATSLFGL